MSTTDWIQFWKIILAIGFGSFALLVLVVIPLGARDVLRLFRKLDEKSKTSAEREERNGE